MKPIKTALCSFGMSGWVFHAPFISVHPGFEFYAVLERTRNLAREKYPAVKTFRTLEDMLADEQVELVIVNTPSITHFDIAKQVIMAGKHLVVEKPFTPTVAEAATLIEMADKKKVKLSVYHNRRYDSDYRTVKKVLDEGLLGNIIDAEIHYDRYTPELSVKAHKETPTPGVGSLYDLGSHLIDQALQLFGMPLAVSADIASFRPGSQVTDYFDLKLFYPSQRVTLKSSYYVREALPGYIFHGTKGSFIKPKTDVQETDLQAGKTPGTDNWGIEPEREKGLLHTEKDARLNDGVGQGMIVREYIPSLPGNYLDYYTGIFETIRNGKQLPVTATEAMEVISIIEAALESNSKRKVIDL